MKTAPAPRPCPPAAPGRLAGRPSRPARRGSSLVEVQVAFTLLGVGLMGICQVAVMQLRHVRVLERRLQGQVVQTSAATGTSTTMLTGTTYYLVPWRNPLTGKLGAAAQISASATSACDPGPLAVPQTATGYPVTIRELDASAGSQNLTAYVDVNAPSAGS